MSFEQTRDEAWEEVKARLGFSNRSQEVRLLIRDGFGVASKVFEDALKIQEGQISTHLDAAVKSVVTVSQQDAELANVKSELLALRRVSKAFVKEIELLSNTLRTVKLALGE